MMKMLQLIEKN